MKVRRDFQSVTGFTLLNTRCLPHHTTPNATHTHSRQRTYMPYNTHTHAPCAMQHPRVAGTRPTQCPYTAHTRSTMNHVGPVHHGTPMSFHATLSHVQMALRSQQQWGNCTFPATAAFSNGNLHLADFRIPKDDVSQTSVGPVTVRFPPSFQNASLSVLKGATVDVSLMLVPAVSPLITDAVTVTLADPGTSAEVPVEGLLEPIDIAFPRPTQPLYEPLVDWYQCAYDAGGLWRADGLWLTGDAQGLQCHTTHLTTIAVLPVVRVLQVQVFGGVCAPGTHARDAF